MKYIYLYKAEMKPNGEGPKFAFSVFVQTVDSRMCNFEFPNSNSDRLEGLHEEKKRMLFRLTQL